MHYQVKDISSENLAKMIDFLKSHEDFSLFLLGNFENWGFKLIEAPYSGNYKAIFALDEIVAVFCLTKNGSLLIQSTISDPIFEIVLNSCLEEKMPIQRLIGEWTFCSRFWDYLKTRKVIQKEVFASKEILYSLENLDFSTQPSVQLLKESDYEQWMPLRLNFLNEQGLPQVLTDKELFNQFLNKVHKRITWGLFFNQILVSVADLNAKALDLGQVGGVYTHPQYRHRGYSRAVIMQLLHDVKSLHSIRKVIIFTGENNHFANKLYQSLGVLQKGHFALFFGE